jgi:hypothetical protein
LDIRLPPIRRNIHRSNIRRKEARNEKGIYCWTDHFDSGWSFIPGE